MIIELLSISEASYQELMALKCPCLDLGFINKNAE